MTPPPLLPQQLEVAFEDLAHGFPALTHELVDRRRKGDQGRLAGFTRLLMCSAKASPPGVGLTVSTMIAHEDGVPTCW